jgi:hypothetical protein
MTTSRAAEGTPRLALELCRIWQREGIRGVMTPPLPRPDDRLPPCNTLRIERVCSDMADQCHARHGTLAVERNAPPELMWR